ncbi:Hypothetical protein HVR_LOCUS1118 [uncultured virus]|nr:Hypothetical protein HVR_LOCUS1118 [uncultured virus]
MNYLTAYNIQRLATSVLNDIVLHPTSIAYIQTLIGPYAKVLDTATSVTAIRMWIPQALLNVVSVSDLDTAIEDLSKLKGGLKDGPEFVELAKSRIIDILVVKLIADVDRDVLFYKGDNYVIPWDIKESLFFHETMAAIFGITKGDEDLPVEIIIDGMSHTHNFTEEFTMGLLLYSLMAQRNFEIRLFGIPFSKDYFLNPNGNRYTKFCSNRRQTEYSVNIGGVKYCFITVAFMQGFATGAEWYKDDHHKYWSDLTSYDDFKGRLITF